MRRMTGFAIPARPTPNFSCICARRIASRDLNCCWITVAAASIQGPVFHGMRWSGSGGRERWMCAGCTMSKQADEAGHEEDPGCCEYVQGAQ